MSIRRLAAYLATASVTGWLIGSIIPNQPVAAQVGQSTAIPGTDALLEPLRSALPFSAVLPEFERDGSSIENLMWNETLLGESGFDIWYRTGDDHHIHLWESNIADLREKDPTVGGAAVVINGVTWNLLRLPDDALASFAIATRLANGVVVSFDTMENEPDSLVNAAEQLVIP